MHLHLPFEMERELLVNLRIDSAAPQDSAGEGEHSSQHAALLCNGADRRKAHPDWSTRFIDNANCSQLAVSV